MGKSRLVIAALVSFMAGIFLGDLIHLDIWWLVGIGAGIFLTLIFQWRDQYWRLGLLIFLGLTLGLGYFNIWDSHQKTIALSYGREQTIAGQVIGHPDFLGNQANYVLKFNKTKIQLTIGRYPEYHYGDVLRVTGQIKESNPYSFHQGILGQILNPEKLEKIGSSGNIVVKNIYLIRDKFEQSLNKSLSEPFASFAAGLVLGSKRNIPDSLMSDFNRTGTTHIVAVSGYNLTILIIYISLLLGLFSRQLKFWGALFIIITFAVMTGAPASVVRAGILAGLVLLGHHLGRRINMTILLLLVASIMLIFSPYAIKYDIGFQLSFLAFAGLVYLGPIIARMMFIRSLPNILKSTLAETTAAQIMVLPILIFNFGRLSFVSPVVNILILWIIPATMGLVLLIGISGLIWISLGQIAGYFGWLFLKYIIVIVENFSKIPWAAWSFKTTEWWWMVIFYSLVGLVIYRLKPSLNKSHELS